MRRLEIEGSRVVFEFKNYWHEWECDGYGWVTEDGRIWFSSHGAAYVVSALDVEDKIRELEEAVSDMIKAMAVQGELLKYEPPKNEDDS